MLLKRKNSSMENKLLGLLLLFSCATTPVKTESPESQPTTKAAAIPMSQPTPEKKSQRPVLVKGTLIEPYEGRKLATFPVVGSEHATPAETPGQYWAGEVLIDAETQKILKQKVSEFWIEKNAEVVRRDETGKTLWSTTPGERLGSLRAPDLLWDQNGVYVATDAGVIALEQTSGKLLWRALGPNDHLALFGGLLIGVDCSHKEAKEQRWLVAYQTIDGKPFFRVELPNNEEPETPVILKDRVLVRGDHYTIVLDATGRELFRLSERASLLHPLSDGGFLAITDKQVMGLRPDGKTRWSLKGFRDGFVQGSGIVPLPSGDFVLYNYGAISDSGVELLYINATEGKERWRYLCPPLLVDHSEYYHQAYVELRGDDLIVVSQGSYGEFIEIVSKEDGRSQKRHQWKEF